MSTETGELSPAEAAEYMGVNDSTIRRWIKQGILPAERLGPRLLRIRKADLDRVRQPAREVAS